MTLTVTLYGRLLEPTPRDMQVVLVYEPADPFAIQMQFGTDPITTWLTARDLLWDGLTRPAGEGDVLVYPTSPWCTAVFIRLRTAVAQALIELQRGPLQQFLMDTFTVMRYNAELDAGVLARELDNLLGREAS